jgi:hypothetical protein
MGPSRHKQEQSGAEDNTHTKTRKQKRDERGEMVRGDKERRERETQQ